MSLLSEFSQLEDGYKTHLESFCADVTANYLILGALRFIHHLEGLGVSSLDEIRYPHCEIWIHYLKHNRKLRENSLFFNARCVRHFIKFLLLKISSINRYFPPSFELYKKPRPQSYIDIPDDRSIQMLINILRQNLNSHLNWRSYITLRLLLSTELSIKEVLNLKDGGINSAKRKISEGESCKVVKCSKSLFRDVMQFKRSRDEYIPSNSDYLIRSFQGFHLDYRSGVRDNMYKQWRLFASVNINARLIKAYRLRK